MPQLSYPLDLIEWSGDKKFGVKKPFDDESGRPVNRQLETSLVKKINEWVEKLITSPASNDVPRNIFLVGGPGNGKTDVVEHCISKLDEQLGSNGSLIAQFVDAFEQSSGTLPPRRVEVGANSYQSTFKNQFDFILVQDATEADIQLQLSPEKALLNDLDSVRSNDLSRIYICCVNRGIISELTNLEKETSTSALLDDIIAASKTGNNDTQCWPLQQFPHVAVWPMDEESLVTSNDGNAETIAHQIFHAALNKNFWKKGCPAGEFCPFCTNQKLLSDQDNLSNLIKLLRYYEYQSGRKWTFRDLFSLVPYILVGDASKFVDEHGVVQDPCEWAAEKLAAYRSRDDAFTELYELVNRLYYHRLFSIWPQLRSGSHYAAIRKLLRKSDVAALINQTPRERCRQHYSYLSRYDNYVSNPIHGRIGSEEFNNLDPAKSRAHESIYSDIRVKEIDDTFSIGVKTGLAFCENRIAPLESELLNSLVASDEDLIASNFEKSDSGHAKLLQNSLRRFCTILVKRSLGVRGGNCAKAKVFAEYENLYTSTEQRKKVRQEFSKLINRDNQFRIGLATTFGQPVTNMNRNITLTTREIKINLERLVDQRERPGSPVPTLRVSGIPVPITFQLFDCIQAISDGMLEASLPEEIFAMIDSVKSRVGGNAVRDDDVLENGVELSVGSKKAAIEVFEGELDVTWEHI